MIPEPPEVAGAASLVLVLEGEPPLVHAVSLDDPPMPLLELIAEDWNSGDTLVKAVAFYYEQPLSFYDLLPGRIRVAADGDRSCGLASPEAMAEWSPGEVWASRDPTGHPSLRRLVDVAIYGCEPVNLCRTFTAEILELPSTRHALILLPLDETTALVGMQDGTFAEVDRTGARELEERFGLPATAGALSEDGEIWLGGDHGRVARGTAAAGFEEMKVGSDIERFGALAPRGLGEDLEVLTLSVDVTEAETSTVRVRRYSRGEWTVLMEAPDERSDWRQSGIVWTGDGEALVVFGGEHGLRYRDGALVSFRLEGAIGIFESNLNGVAISENGGPVIGGGDGYLHAPKTDELLQWEAIGGAVLADTITGLGPVYEGFIFGGADGQTNQYYPGAVPCDGDRLVGSDVERILQVGDAVLVTGGNPDPSRANTVTWLVP